MSGFWKHLQELKQAGYSDSTAPNQVEASATAVLLQEAQGRLNCQVQSHVCPIGPIEEPFLHCAFSKNKD